MFARLNGDEVFYYTKKYGQDTTPQDLYGRHRFPATTLQEGLAAQLRAVAQKAAT
jgi:hypothetical protein